MKFPFIQEFDELSNYQVLLPIQISNSSKKNHEIILFDKDFKLPKGVEIKSEEYNVTYENILESIGSRDIQANFIRIVCIENSKQAIQRWQRVDEEEDFFPVNAYLTPYQEQDGIIDIPISFTATKDTRIKINILSGVKDFTVYFCKYKENTQEKHVYKKESFAERLRKKYKKWIQSRKPKKNPAKNISELEKILQSPIEFLNNSLPIALYITNKSNQAKKATLFFAGDNYVLKNHGQDKDIDIKSGNVNVSYSRILSYFLGHKIKFSFARLSCTSNTAQVRKFIRYKTSNIEGQSIQISIYTKMSLSCYQQQIGFNDVKLNHTIDEGSGYEIEILPKTTLTAYFYPALS